jgi:hypothetical protein
MPITFSGFIGDDWCAGSALYRYTLEVNGMKEFEIPQRERALRRYCASEAKLRHLRDRENVMVQPELERRSSPLGVFRPSVGDFQGIGVFRSDDGWEQRKKFVPALPIIVSMSPLGYPWTLVASLQSPLPFRPAKSL